MILDKIKSRLRILFFLCCVTFTVSIFLFLLLINTKPEHNIIRTLCLIANVFLFGCQNLFVFWLQARWKLVSDLAVVRLDEQKISGDDRFFYHLWPKVYIGIAWTVPVLLIILTVVSFLRVVDLSTETDLDDTQSIVPTLLIIGASTVAILFAGFLIFGSVFIKIQLDRKIEDCERDHIQFPVGQRVPWEFGHTLALEIGIAFLVAGFITATYELLLRGFTEQETERRNARHKAQQERFYHEQFVQLNHNMFKFVLGHDVDPALREELYKLVAYAKFARKNLIISFDFDDLTTDDTNELGLTDGDATNYIKVLVDVSYDLYNNSAAVEIFPSATMRWAPFFENAVHLSDKFDKYTRVSISGCVEKDGFVKNGGLMDGDFKTALVSSELTRYLNLTPAQILVNAGKDSVHIDYTYRMLKRREDSHDWISTRPIENYTIIANDHTSGKLGFHLKNVSRSEPALTRISESHYKWTSDASTLLPHQGILLFWFPKMDTETDGKSKAVAK